MATVTEVFEANRHLFRSVPRYQLFQVCAGCLGPVDGYHLCFACYRLFNQAGAPAELMGKIVPMTVTENPGAWYSRLVNYKRLQREYRPILGSLAYTWLESNEHNIHDAIGGEADFITVVPSKRPGITFDNQPLRHALAMVPPLRERLRNVLTHKPGALVGRQQYIPNAFSVRHSEVANRRILLIEDTWVTGATAVSAAGALLNGGARSVMILPLARDVEPRSGFFQADLPYFRWMREPYDPRSWPR